MAWEENGNDIIPGSFLGTTNGLPLSLQTNREERLLIDGDASASLLSSPTSLSIRTQGVERVRITGATALEVSGNGNTGISAYSRRSSAIYARSFAGNAVDAITNLTDAVSASSGDRNGVYGASSNGLASGVYGENRAAGYGVSGRAPGGWAGFFDGNVRVVGEIRATNGTKNFQIDHPLDPENKYLSHTCVESSEMKNVYDGVARLDGEGAAWVELPRWFEALNGDFRYQLTAIGESAPGLHVAEEISDNRFRIAGGEEGMKVCWQVSGIRKDPWAKANPFEVEQEKLEEERGGYLQPDLYDAPEEQRIMIGPPPVQLTPTEERVEDE